MKNLFHRLCKHFFPTLGSSYGLVFYGKLERGVYRLDADEQEGEIYYYSYLSTNHISKRTYKASVFKGVENYSTEDLSPSRERYLLTLGKPQKSALLKQKFLLIQKQYQQYKPSHR